MLSPRLVRLDPRQPRQVQAAARLHAALLPDSPIAELGPIFMERFYYSTLVEHGLVACDLYEVAGEFVGFVAFTRRPLTFMQEGQRRFPLRLAAVLIGAMLTNPARVLTILKVAFQYKRGAAPPAGEEGEVLSFGVLREHRAAVDESTGLRASHLLFQSALNYFHVNGVPRMRVSVRKDNERGMKFYLAYSKDVEDNRFDPGDQCFISMDTARFAGPVAVEAAKSAT